MLDLFVSSRVRRKIIVVFAKYPDFKTHVRGLAKLIKEDPGIESQKCRFPHQKAILKGICPEKGQPEHKQEECPYSKEHRISKAFRINVKNPYDP